MNTLTATVRDLLTELSLLPARQVTVNLLPREAIRIPAGYEVICRRNLCHGTAESWTEATRQLDALSREAGYPLTLRPYYG